MTGTRQMGTEMFTIALPFCTAVGLLFIFAPIVIPIGLSTVGLIVLMNQVCKRRRQNPKTGKWEWCKPQKNVSYLWPKGSYDPSQYQPGGRYSDRTTTGGGGKK